MRYSRTIAKSWRVSLVVLCTLAGGAPAQLLDTPSHRSSQELVTHSVDARAAELEARLQEQEESQDWSWLALMKERDDVLLECLWAPSRMERLPMAHWFDQLDMTYDAASPEARTAWDRPFDAGLSFPNGWAATTRVELHTVVGENYPVLLWFACQGKGEETQALLRYHEPYFNVTNIGMSAMLDGWLLSRDGEHVRLTDTIARKDAASFDVEAGPRTFLNPSTMHNLLDSVKTAIVRERSLPMSVASLAPSQEQTTATGITWSSPRTITIRPGNEQVEVDFSLPQVQLRHESLAAFEIHSQYPDGRIATKDFVPVVRIPFLEGGRSVRVAIASSPTGWIPRSIQVSSAGVSLFACTFEQFQPVRATTGVLGRTSKDEADLREAQDLALELRWMVEDQVAGPRPKVYTRAECVQSSCPEVWRARVGYNVLASLERRNIDAVAAWLHVYADQLHSEGVPDRYMVYNIEWLVDWLTQAQRPDDAKRLASICLARAYAQASPQDLSDHIARLGTQGKLGMGVLAARALQEQTRATPEQRTWAAKAAHTLRELSTDPHAGAPQAAPYYAHSKATTALLLELPQTSPVTATAR